MSAFSCKITYKKIKGDSKKSTLNLMQANKFLDKYNNILNLPKFYEANTELSNKASEKLGKNVRLFLVEDVVGMKGKKAFTVDSVFKELDNVLTSISSPNAEVENSSSLFSTSIAPVTNTTLANPDFTYTSLDNLSVSELEQKLVNGFLKDFGITVEIYADLKNTLNKDAYSATDLLTKTIAHEKGQPILPEIAYVAYSILGNNNNKLRTQLRYLVNKWDGYKESFERHRANVNKYEGYISNKKEWKETIRDKVIYDFLAEKLVQQYENPVAFKKELDTKWTSEDFTTWQKILRAIEKFLELFSYNKNKKAEQLEKVGLSIADEVLSQRYDYFKYAKNEDQIIKKYYETLNTDAFAKELVEFGRNELNIVLTGSLALRKTGSVYRTMEENIHDIDFVVPYEKNAGKHLQKFVDMTKTSDYILSNSLQEYLEEQAGLNDFNWYTQFKEKYPEYKLLKAFYGKDAKDFNSYTITGVIGGEFYQEDGWHDEKVSYFRKDNITKAPVQISETKKVRHKKGDWIADTGYVVDFFMRLVPNQEEHENYFKVWKEIMIAKLKMGRPKDLTDWAAFTPYVRSENKYSYNYKGFSNFTYKTEQLLNNIEGSSDMSCVI